MGASLRCLDAERRGFHGYKLDMAVCTATDLPLAWEARTAAIDESIHALPLVDGCRARGLAVAMCAMDNGGASKWRCPSRECKPASVWIKADRRHPLSPRETPRFTALHRRRTAVVRELGRLKNEWAPSPRRVRGLDRGRLRANLTILAKLACARSRERAVAVMVA